MSVSRLEVRERHFVEELGALFSEAGGAPMMGRVLGRLLIAAEPVQTAAELADYLDASAGSISTTLRQLTQARVVRKVRIPGQRAAGYRLAETAWTDVFMMKAHMNTIFREAAAKGLELLEASDRDTSRLKYFHDFYAFVERRMPQLVDEWLASQAQEES